MAISLVVGGEDALGNEVLSRAFNQRRKLFNVVACALTRKELLKQVAEHQPEVTLINASLGGEPNAGSQALREVRLTRSSTRLVILLDHSERAQVIEAFSNGANGVFHKSGGFEVLCKCIQRVHAGQVWADSTQLHWVVQALGEREPVRIVGPSQEPLLTQREEQIVRMVADGLPNREVAKSLGLSPHTVKNHLFRIYDKLGISNRVELALYTLTKRNGASR